jgi:hypothetical protein
VGEEGFAILLHIIKVQRELVLVVNFVFGVIYEIRHN